MTEYAPPNNFYRGQVLWYDDKRLGSLLVTVLTIKEDKVEINFLCSDNTCHWVKKTELTERRHC